MGSGMDWERLSRRGNSFTRGMVQAMDALMEHPGLTPLVEDLFDCTPEDIAEWAVEIEPDGSERQWQLRLGDILLGAWVGGWRPYMNPDGSQGMELEEDSLAARAFEIVMELKDRGLYGDGLISSATGASREEILEMANYMGRRSPVWSVFALGFVAVGMVLAGAEIPPKEGDGGLDETHKGS